MKIDIRFHHHHHHVTQLARISMTISHQPSLSFIAPGRSSVQHPVSTDTTTAWKNYLFSLSVRSDFHMPDNLFIAYHVFPIRVLTSLSVDEILLSRYVNCSTGFRGLPSSVEMSPRFLKLMNSVIGKPR